MTATTVTKRKGPVRRSTQSAGITESSMKQFPWLLKYKGSIVAGSIFSAVLFGYVQKHESTASHYEVVKNSKHVAPPKAPRK